MQYVIGPTYRRTKQYAEDRQLKNWMKVVEARDVQGRSLFDGDEIHVLSGVRLDDPRLEAMDWLATLSIGVIAWFREDDLMKQEILEQGPQCDYCERTDVAVDRYVRERPCGHLATHNGEFVPNAFLRLCPPCARSFLDTEGYPREGSTCRECDEFNKPHFRVA